jgi:hypothetical protein
MADVIFETPLETAIWNQFNNDAQTKAVFVNGLWNTDAPQDTPYPYGTFIIIGDKPQYTFPEDFELIDIVFILHSKTSGSAIQLEQMYHRLKMTFDFTVLTIEGYTSVGMKRRSARKLKAEDVWTYTVVYSLLIQKNKSRRKSR